MALARAEHELQLMLRRPAVQQAFDERGAQIVEAATGTPGTLRPLQREVLMRAAAAPLTSIAVSVGTGYGKTLLAPALACLLQRDVVAIVPLERLSVQVARAARPVLGDANVCVVPFGAGGVPRNCTTAGRDRKRIGRG